RYSRSMPEVHPGAPASSDIERTGNREQMMSLDHPRDVVLCKVVQSPVEARGKAEPSHRCNVAAPHAVGPVGLRINHRFSPCQRYPRLTARLVLTPPSLPEGSRRDNETP